VEKGTLVKQDQIVECIKAQRNEREMKGMRDCHVRDSAALIKYFSWLESKFKEDPNAQISEYDGARKIDELRTLGQHAMGPSFDTISSIGPNGAVIHYKPEKNDCKMINNKEIYLLDSGGQYLDGTTDVTRSIHFGGAEPTAFQKEMYTRVLLGVLGVERMVWPSTSKISGADIDVLARRHIWEVGKEYRHGTGHGVGYFLCVHEGPVGVSRGVKEPFKIGHCVSDEPGYYEDGEFGIRIENVIMVVQHEKYADRLKFENMTVCPYERRLIDKSLLSQFDIDYINAFHKRCQEKLTPLLEGDELALDYLKRYCAEL